MAADNPLRRPLLPPSSRLANGHLRLSGTSTLKGDELALVADQPERSPRRGFWCRRTAALLLLTLLAAGALGAGCALQAGWRCQAAAAAARIEARYPRFLVVGDWGRRGEHNQTAVAAAMARKAAALPADFVISTGDNFYPSGLTSPFDPQFDESFTDVYYQKSLQVPWHVVLGNHDHGQFTDGDPQQQGGSSSSGSSGRFTDADPQRQQLGGSSGSSSSSGGGGGGSSGSVTKRPKCGSWDRGCFYSPLHQLDVRLAARDARWHAERSYSLSLASGQVELFFIDTTPLMEEYRSVPWRRNRGGLAEQSPEGQLRELEGRLARSAAAWKVVVGHHPIRSNHRERHEVPELVRQLEPLLQRYGVQALLAGHDHNLQVMHKPGTGYVQVTSGAGSRLSSSEFQGTEDSLFQAAVNGFVAVSLAPDSMVVECMGLVSEQPLFQLEIPRRRHRRWPAPER